ncbi:uncharacterized protein LOC131056813 [Cryptomeria japonica]|uniref:uncharacterized protein LOC131056813 n=1 Tax=Cryptomeria japonica TaxID=3369 RepID=UPI0025ABD1DF|nr:uncharacterized protein LOC131056813 [Cryptomeria japonica]
MHKLWCVQNKDIKRLFFSAFYHVDDSHFVYNMESLLREGVQLEMKGSTDFASAVVVLLGMSHGIEILNSNPLKKELGIRKSLLGDVSGIIAGYLYLWLQRFFSCSNPFRPILRKFTWVVCLPLRLVQGYLNWW